MFEEAGDKMLRECADLFTLSKRSSGKRLFYQGATAELVYLLNEGSVRLSRVLGNGREMITMLGPGDVFGDEALFAPSSAREMLRRLTTRFSAACAPRICARL